MDLRCCLFRCLNKYSRKSVLGRCALLGEVNPQGLKNFGARGWLWIQKLLPLLLVYLRGDYIYTLGGEGGIGCAFGKLYGQHPDLVMRGRIKISTR